MKFLKKKYYSSCESLPLWNFFKINSEKEQNVKYLVVLSDRLDYDGLIIDDAQRKELTTLWDFVFEEYNTLDSNHSVANFNNDRASMLYYYALYLQEQAMLKSLLYRTNAQYIRYLRKQGYELSNRSQTEYWECLYNGLHKVENHLSYIETLKIKMQSEEGTATKEGNPYDSIMAWIASNDIRVEENITVARYLKIREIIQAKLKAKQKNQRAQLA